MLIFLSGGAKSGKSHFAQDLALTLAKGGHRYYIATMIPVDAEDYRRIDAHLADRAGLGFETLEAPRNLPAYIDRVDSDAVFLLDSATALLMNELFPDPVTWAPDETAGARTAAGILEFAGAVRHMVVVSDCIYSDAVQYDSTTQLYRRSLAEIDRAIAAKADTVLEMVCGNLTVHKGVLPE